MTIEELIAELESVADVLPNGRFSEVAIGKSDNGLAGRVVIINKQAVIVGETP